MLRSRPEQLKLGVGGARCVDERVIGVRFQLKPQCIAVAYIQVPVVGAGDGQRSLFSRHAVEWFD